MPPVSSLIFATGSPSRALTVWVAPNCFAHSSFRGSISTAMIVVAPASLEDRWAYAYGDNRPPERYRYSTTVTLRTGPDDTTYTIDPRRGVVRFEYHHHGTANDVVLERIP